MPSTTRRSRLAAAVLTTAAIAALPTAAADAAVAPLTVYASSADGATVYPQPQPDGTMVLALPHDGAARTITLDAFGTVAMSDFSFDVEGDGHLTTAPNRGSALDVTPAFDRARTSTVHERGGTTFSVSATTSLRWLVAYQPTVGLQAPATTRLGDDTLFDASNATAWNGNGTTRPVAHWEWELPDTTISTDAPRLLHRFATTGPNCLTVRAVDVTGARSEPSTACTTVARPVTLPSPATQAAQPVTPISVPTQTPNAARIKATNKVPVAAILDAPYLTITGAHVTGEGTVKVRVRVHHLSSQILVGVHLRQRWGNGTFRVSDSVTRKTNAWFTLRPYSDTRSRTTEVVAATTGPGGRVIAATATVRLP